MAPRGLPGPGGALVATRRAPVARPDGGRMRRVPLGVYWPELDLVLFVDRSQAVWLHRRRVIRWVESASC